jgi:predicted phosphodiesterase
VRTLVVSDFHLGLGPRHAVLEWPRPQERLLAALERVQRLVLLGDILELIDRPAAEVLAVAEPLLRAIGERLGPDGEIVYVPGNHDHALIAGWLLDRPEPLALDTEVPPDASPALERVADRLGPALTIRYPGTWLADGVWATHGHYLDHHLLPTSSWGIGRGPLARVAGARPEDYEPHRRRSLRQLIRRLPPPLHWLLSRTLDLARMASMPISPGRVLHPRLAPLTAPLLSFQMRHASVPALVRVAQGLGVRADTIVFGHAHRLGPLPGEDPAPWRVGPDAPSVHNCGSWVYEPLLVHRAAPPHPYWPGGAILFEDGRPPQALGLLDELAVSDMHRPWPRRRRNH